MVDVGLSTVIYDVANFKPSQTEVEREATWHITGFEFEPLRENT